MSTISKVSHDEIPREYKTDIPDFLFVLLERGEISLSDFILYCRYSSIIQQGIICDLSIKELCKITRLSQKTISNSRRNLSNKFELLGGQSLINVESCNRRLGKGYVITINNFSFKYEQGNLYV